MAIKTNTAGMEDVFALYVDGEQVDNSPWQEIEGVISPKNADASVQIKGEEVAVKSDIPDAYVDPNWTTTGTARKNLTMGIYKLQQSSNPTANADVVNKQTLDAQMALKADKTEVLWELGDTNLITPKDGRRANFEYGFTTGTSRNDIYGQNNMWGTFSFLGDVYLAGANNRDVYTKEEINAMLKVVGGEVLVFEESVGGNEGVYDLTALEMNTETPYRYILNIDGQHEQAISGRYTLITYSDLFRIESLPYPPVGILGYEIRVEQNKVLYYQEIKYDFEGERRPNPTNISKKFTFVRYPRNYEWEQYLNYLNLSKELLPTGEPKQWISFADWTQLPASQGGGLDEETIPA